MDLRLREELNQNFVGIVIGKHLFEESVDACSSFAWTRWSGCSTELSVLSSRDGQLGKVSFVVVLFQTACRSKEAKCDAECFRDSTWSNHVRDTGIGSVTHSHLGPLSWSSFRQSAAERLPHGTRSGLLRPTLTWDPKKASRGRQKGWLRDHYPGGVPAKQQGRRRCHRWWRGKTARPVLFFFVNSLFFLSVCACCAKKH